MFKYKGNFKPFFSRPKFAPGVKANSAQKNYWLPKQYTDAAKARYVPPKVCGLAFKGWTMNPMPRPKYYSIPQGPRFTKRYSGPSALGQPRIRSPRPFIRRPGPKIRKF